MLLGVELDDFGDVLEMLEIIIIIWLFLGVLEITCSNCSWAQTERFTKGVCKKAAQLQLLLQK